MEHQGLKPKASLRCGARKGGAWGRGSPLPQAGVRGSPREIFGKLPENGEYWCILEAHGNLILQKPFLHFRARLNCDVEQNYLCHIVDHT